MSRWANSWQMFKTSAEVLRSRKELALFPVLSGVVSIAVAVIVFGPIILAVLAVDSRPLVTVAIVGMYFVLAYVTVFFNAALITQANVALQGGDPSVKDGLRAAGAKWSRLLPWALITATVSYLISVIQERLGFLGRLIGGLLDLAWRVVTFLVLPKLVLEDRGVVEAIKSSATDLKHTWGENLVANVGFGLIGFAASLPGIGLIALGASLGGAMLIFLAAVAVVWLIVVAVVIAALTGIYQTALYRYATDARVPPGFGDADLGHAFTMR